MGRRTRTPRVNDPAGSSAGSAHLRSLRAFVVERFPLSVDAVVGAISDLLPDQDGTISRAGLSAEIDRRRPAIRSRLIDTFSGSGSAADLETTPGVRAPQRMREAAVEVADAVDGYLRREAIRFSLTADERREILRGMMLTRATDNQLKALFLGGQVRFGNTTFQGKGFRSLGQEAIYAAPLRLRRGVAWRGADGRWRGDVVAPLIRDLGAALAMRPDEESVRRVLSAQMGKSGPPMEGKDFHIGDLEWGILPATAPLAISSASIAGFALAFARSGDGRVAVSFIGEGGSSLGEWHESINACAARRLPAIFCVENNQTALSTPVHEQSAVRVFADKAAGYGIPGITLDGTDPEAIAAAFAWGAERARAGLGPVLIELVTMRMCGHAHHDDMLYVGKEPPIGWDYPELSSTGYADASAWAFWAPRDPLRIYARQLLDDRVIDSDELSGWRSEIESLVGEQTRRVVEAPWPDPEDAGRGVVAGEPVRRHSEPLDRPRGRRGPRSSLPELDPGPAFDSGGRTFLEAIMLGTRDALANDPRVFVVGQDVGGTYGNAFLMLRPLLAEYRERILNSTLAEGAILGIAIGAALAGERPIAEIQFNDFIATGFNQLVNNAAKIRYRWGGSVPIVVRLPWGGLRRAGPYHSQNTEAWFYRTPGLKIVVPSTPFDARALFAAALADPDPVLFYEHIALYRDPKIKQALDDAPALPLPLGKAALRRAGSDLAIVSYGAYVHLARQVAERLAADGIEASVLDLRCLEPLDREALLAVSRHCGKVLIVHEDSRRGGVGESLAAWIQEEAFEDLDAPIRVIGALDAPVPYSPPLEDAFLAGSERIEAAARRLAAY